MKWMATLCMQIHFYYIFFILNGIYFRSSCPLFELLCCSLAYDMHSYNPNVNQRLPHSAELLSASCSYSQLIVTVIYTQTLEQSLNLPHYCFLIQFSVCSGFFSNMLLSQTFHLWICPNTHRPLRRWAWLVYEVFCHWIDFSWRVLRPSFKGSCNCSGRVLFQPALLCRSVRTHILLLHYM